ncbi:MAG: polysaccharide biosynthesis tyrosine autokinase [Chlamydiae bacterium]|nr:polysaccharide biosynthesis tyrosine autokinase [Chlamydiota bacterium]MBI3267310.1 polysaccharide biosynthesis tyrosine autokinase [Chlamydiota bacterium]
MPDQTELRNNRDIDSRKADVATPLILTDYLRIIWKRKWLFLSIVMTTVSIATVKTYSTTPLYDASCKIMIEKEQDKILTVQDVYQASWDGDYMNTQYKILTSRSFARRIYDELKVGETEKTSLDAFMSSYRIEPVRDTRISNITVRHADPQKAALFADTIANLFIDQNLERKLGATQHAVNWLSKELEEMQEKINKSEQALEEYVKANNIVSLPKTDLSEDQSVTFSYFSQEKVRLEEELSKLEKRYKEKHPKILRTKAELATVTEKLDEEISNITDLRQKQVQYRALKREVDENQQLFNAMLNRVKETDLLKGLTKNNISIVDRAEVPQNPAWPNKKKTILLSFLLSFLGAIGLVLLLENLDTSFRHDEDVERTLGLPVLGHIPLSSVVRKGMSAKEIALTSFTHPNSNFAEAYRYVRTGISFSAVDKPHPVLLVTSTHPKEGKTTEVVNLGATMAANGEKVLIIDADMRRPTLHKILPSKSTGKKLGLSNYLVENISEDSVIGPTQIPNLWVLNCGDVPPNPSEILGSQKMRKLLEWTRTHFQRVIIDSPPAMAVADSIVLSGMVDGVVYIIKANKTSRKTALQSIQRLREARSRILGIVLNQVTPKGSGYYYYYNYKYNYYSQNGERQKEAEKTRSIDEVVSSRSS